MSHNSDQHIEIERKFLYNFDIDAKLDELKTQMSIKLLNDCLLISDDYYDNEECFLVLNDYWLRSRQTNHAKKSWELKYKNDASNKVLDTNFAKYYESSDEREICAIILRLANLKCLDEIQNMETLIERFQLKSFALIKSIRRSYLVDSNLRVDLDETDFGYKLGEIEIVLDNRKCSQADVDSATNKINELGFKLGIQKFDNIPGKMSIFLEKSNPKIYKILISRNIIKDASLASN